MTAVAPATGTFAYAPKVVRTYLTSVLDPAIRVATEVPANRPALLVTITTVPTGSGNNLALSARRVVIACYHPNEQAAGDLAELVYAHMKSAMYMPGNGIRHVTTVGTPAKFPDPDDSTPRFQMTFDILLRATF